MSAVAILGIIVACLTIFGTLGTILAKSFLVGRQIGELAKLVKQTAHLAGFVPGIYHRVSNIEHRLEISTPEFPSFIDGHDAEE